MHHDSHTVTGLACRLRQRPRLKRVAVDIFARGFLSMLTSPPATDDRSKSSQDRRPFSPETAMRRRTSSPAPRAFCHLDFCPSICVESASRGTLPLPAFKEEINLAEYFLRTF